MLLSPLVFFIPKMNISQLEKHPHLEIHSPQLLLLFNCSLLYRNLCVCVYVFELTDPFSQFLHRNKLWVASPDLVEAFSNSQPPIVHGELTTVKYNNQPTFLFTMKACLSSTDTDSLETADLSVVCYRATTTTTTHCLYIPAPVCVDINVGESESCTRLMWFIEEI